MIVKTTEEIENLRKSGKILADALRLTAAMVKPGVTTAELDLAAEKYIRDQGGEPAFLNYSQDGSAYPFPAALCVSINDEVVHGIPSELRTVAEGDLVMLDLGVSYNGYFSDAAITVFAGTADEAGQKLADATKEALKAAIKIIKPGVRVGDIGAAIAAVAKKYNFAVVEDLGGHSLGLVPHEPPYIGNVGVAGKGEVLPQGLVIAVEPIFTEGK
ncbi:MAG TPA: type I methionyl aminopeptidase, partial [Candidatus Paceibacterota bacterium]|nr:type I methionyl aminopeptidase [Candidatus Paceibacterota bacterium]